MSTPHERVESSYATIFRLARTESKVYIVGFILIFVTNVIETAWVRATALAVEEVWRGSATAATAGIIMGLALVVFLFRCLNRNVTFLAGRRIERRLRTRIFRSAIGLSQDEMDKHRTGDLVSRIINDVSDIRLVLGSGFLQVTNNIIAYAVTIATMLALVPKLAIVAILPFLPLFWIAKKLTAATHERSKRSQEALGALSSAVEETVGGIEVIKSHTAEPWQLERFCAANERHYDAELARTRPESVFVGLMGSVVWIGIAAILLAGGALLPLALDHPESSGGIGDLATFIFLFARLVWPTGALGWIMNVIQRGLAASTRVEMFLTETVQGDVTRAADFDPRKTSLIELRHVSFTY
ncbi:MAG: ABC transporter transmembrane domain-containing protein, partial [Candidatus Hydrogenedentota bacterium]